jgi:Na+-transporting NADH:ubiquinone oxidoreductase subunit NqrB
MHFSDGSDGEMRRALLLTKRPPVHPFSVHMPENVVKVSAIYQLQSKEVGTKHTQTSRVPDRWVQHILHAALNDYLYKPQVQQEIRNSDRLLEICHQFLKLWLVIETCQTFWLVTRHIFTFRYCYCKELLISDIRNTMNAPAQHRLYCTMCCFANVIIVPYILGDYQRWR